MQQKHRLDGVLLSPHLLLELINGASQQLCAPHQHVKKNNLGVGIRCCCEMLIMCRNNIKANCSLICTKSVSLYCWKYSSASSLHCSLIFRLSRPCCPLAIIVEYHYAIFFLVYHLISSRFGLVILYILLSISTLWCWHCWPWLLNNLMNKIWFYEDEWCGCTAVNKWLNRMDVW